jgi:MraZ protein
VVHQPQIDHNGRLALPSAFRTLLGDSCYLVIGEERCIDVMPRDAFEEMASELMRQARNKEISLNRQRALAHSAALVTLDKQGRVTLDEKMRTYARLSPSSRVVVPVIIDDSVIESWVIIESVVVEW